MGECYTEHALYMPEVCIWTPALPPKGIAPQAFSWWDCKGHRRYGYPVLRVCDECGKGINFAQESTASPPCASG